MIRYENDCIDCSKELKRCNSCRFNHSSVHLICDNCKEDVEEMYQFDDKELCIECVKECLTKIEIEDI